MSRQRIFTNKNLEELNWEEYNNGILIQDYFQPLIQNETTDYIQNLDCEFALLENNRQLIPIAISQKNQRKSAYVASASGQYILYPIDEFSKLDVLKGINKYLSIYSLSLMYNLYKPLGFDNNVFVNAFALSSNLWSNTKLQIKELLDSLLDLYPGKHIVFKGLNEKYHSELIAQLKSLGFISVFSRELFFMDPALSKLNKKRAFVRDKKLAEKLSDEIIWTFPDKLNKDEKKLFLGYYRDLYINKYSKYNPEYSSEFLDLIEVFDQTNIGTLRKNGQLMAAQIIFETEKEMTTPFIGYDRDAPKEFGLYRLLNYYLMKESLSKGKLLNMSSGASNFKKQRGGESVFEYNLVFPSSKNAFQALPWKNFEYIGRKVVIPNLNKVDL